MEDLEGHPALAAASAAARAHLDGLRERRVGAPPDVTAQSLRAALGGPVPVRGSEPAEVVERLAAAVGPGLVASSGPRYFGYVVGGTLEAAMAADWLAVAWDQVAGLEVMSPAAAAVEEVTGGWLLDLLGLPAQASFGFPTGAQMANFTALATARHAVLERAGWDVEADGLQGAPRIQVVVGGQVHATVPQALRFAGLGSRPDVAASDEQGRMRPAALAQVLRRDGGPVIVCAQAGNVNTGAFDPFGELADLCAQAGAWLHVDGAFGLWAGASERLRPLVDGVERADSWATDCHKWLNVPYDSAFVATRDPVAHVAAMSWEAPYVVPGAGRDPYRYVVESSRRARGFAIWAALSQLGRDGVADLVDRSCAHARRFASALVAADPRVAVLNDVVLNQVLVRFDDSDDVTRAVLAGVQAGGEAWIGGSTWNGDAVMRISVSGWMTTSRDVDRSVEAVLAALAAART
ncbi:pyridoxal-dependent decarboxylase [Phycicoccus sp. Root563]|uniref:pyridoxal phosphate-dependent decarboxylase family protein n=1 Tax=Phycicoccus sp. Root563 TaxID=1736562 RepID=UPI000702C9C5|nr:pyridoxal-dependent decarboxylase [Phycicoccus sp. Root563]KQZ90043.1 pyridoxal-dependent decarboxylase [Phycicoccus sp. Root563]